MGTKLQSATKWLLPGLLCWAALAVLSIVMRAACTPESTSCDRLVKFLESLQAPMHLVAKPILGALAGVLGITRISDEMGWAGPAWALQLTQALRWCFFLAYWFAVGVGLGAIYRLLKGHVLHLGTRRAD